MRPALNIIAVVRLVAFGAGTTGAVLFIGRVLWLGILASNRDPYLFDLSVLWFGGSVVFALLPRGGARG